MNYNSADHFYKVRMDGSPIYSDDLSRRNGEVYRLTAALYGSSARGTTTEEQAVSRRSFNSEAGRVSRRFQQRFNISWR